MADIKKALKKLWEVEYSNNPELFLHRNPTEDEWTLGGIYQKYHQGSIDWEFIKNIVMTCGFDMKRASKMLFYDDKIQDQIAEVYKLQYWDRLRLDYINVQSVAENAFLFGVVSGVKNSAKVMQKVANVLDDGVIGNISIKAVNDMSMDDFNNSFDNLEIDYFRNLVEEKPKLAIYLNGWENRARLV